MAETTTPTAHPWRLSSTVDCVTVRPARPDDTDALVALVERCSELSLYRRFHGAAGPYVWREIERIANPTAMHRSWVALGAGGDVRGTATLAWGRAGDVHAAFLVDDTWQRRGVGRSLYRALARAAVAAGLPAVTATVLGDNGPALRFMRAMAPDVRSRFVDGVVEVHLPVRPSTAARSRQSRPSSPIAASARPAQARPEAAA
jgi:GNAT superfamily N-acetyltransferase